MEHSIANGNTDGISMECEHPAYNFSLLEGVRTLRSGYDNPLDTSKDEVTLPLRICLPPTASNGTLHDFRDLHRMAVYCGRNATIHLLPVLNGKKVHTSLAQ